MNEYIETNRRHWDEVVAVHAASSFYDVASFKAGRSTLSAVEREEVGGVSGKTMLHLQCHFGLDTLSWAREGAIVTGVDFAPQAIRTARELAAETGIDARFIESNVYDLPRVLDETFDMVFASYGVLCWLPDIREGARIAARYVRPGGVFYIVDGHPLFGTLWDSPGADEIVIRHSYFGPPDPAPAEDEGTYADRTAKLQNRRTYEFDHPLGSIVTALVDSVLRLEFLHEFPFSGYEALPGMQKGDDGYYHLPPGSPQIPFVFSLRGTKPRD
jgi:SAM-dependent methyltransferase